MNSPHHPHHEHHDVHQQRLLWFFSFCNQRSSSSSTNSSLSANSSRQTRTARRKSAASRNKFALQYQQQLQQQQRQSSNVFGLDLTEHTQKYSDDDLIPFIVKTCTKFIEKHGIISGIYRLNGMRVNIHKLRQEFDKNPKITMIENESISNDAHAVACVLKQYFRELPTPLLTFHMYEDFIQLFKKTKSTCINHDQPLTTSVTTTTTTTTTPTPKTTNLQTKTTIMTTPSDIIYQVKLDDLRKLLLQLPPAHYQTLKFLMYHLASIAANGQKTGMDSKNVAIVWAPNLLKPRELELSAGLETLQVIGLQAVITEQLIKHHDFLFDEGENLDARSQDIICNITRTQSKD